MTTTTLVDRVKIIVVSSGTSPFQLGNAAAAYRGVEALTDGATYNYAAESGSLFEAGTSVYLASSNTLVRSPQISSNNGAAVSFPAGIEVSFTVLAADIAPVGSLPIVQTTGNGTTVAMSQDATTTELTALSDAIATKVTASEARAAISAGAGLAYNSGTGEMALADLSTLLGILNGTTVQASEALVAGDFVNVYSSGGAARVRKASALDPALFANGFVLDDISSGATGGVIFSGVNLATTVGTAASEVWLSDTTPGGWMTTPPSASGSIIQSLGAAVPSVGVFFAPRERSLLSD